jgi:hypothetical protein
MYFALPHNFVSSEGDNGEGAKKALSNFTKQSTKKNSDIFLIDSCFDVKYSSFFYFFSSLQYYVEKIIKYLVSHLENPYSSS